MKSYWKIILFFVLVIIVISGGLFYYMSRGLDSGSELPINNVNLSDLEDGTYTGTYQGGRWSNTVEVTIKDKADSTIKTRTFEINNTGTKTGNQLTGNVAGAQSKNFFTNFMNFIRGLFK